MIHVLLPAFNEEKALGDVISRLAQTLAGQNYHAWVVNDGSQDKTAEVALSWGKKIPLTLHNHHHNEGLGRALQSGFDRILERLAPSDVVVTLDADNTHPPELIPAMVQPIERQEADLVIASRFRPGAKMMGVPLMRRFTSWGARIFFRLFFYIPHVRDYTCGYRAYRGQLLLKARKRWGTLISETGFAAMAECLIKLSRLSPRIQEVPLILHYDRKPTPSKMPVLQTIRRTVALIHRLKKIP